MIEKLINIEEASKFLGIHPKTLRKDIINKGLLPVISIGKGARGDRISPSDLEQYVGERKCYIKGEKRGGQSFPATGKKLDDPLGQPTKKRLKKPKAKLRNSTAMN